MANRKIEFRGGPFDGRKVEITPEAVKVVTPVLMPPDGVSVSYVRSTERAQDGAEIWVPELANKPTRGHFLP